MNDRGKLYKDVYVHWNIPDILKAYENKTIDPEVAERRIKAIDSMN